MAGSVLDEARTIGTGSKPVPRTGRRRRAHRQSLLARAKASLGLYLLIAPTFILLAIFNVVPFVWAFDKSFYDFEIGEKAHFVGFHNYIEYFHDYTFAQSFGHMFFLTGFALVIVMIVPLAVAKLIFSLSSERASYIYRVLFLVPIVVPGVALLLIWQGMIYSDSGILNEILRAAARLLHRPPDSFTSAFLSSPHGVLWAIAFIGFPFCGGINILIYYAGLTSIPESVHEAAILDGAMGVKKFLLVDVPLVMSQMKLLVALAIIAGVQGFENILILTRGGPGFKSMVPGLWMYFCAFSFQKFGYACAIGVVLFIVIMGLTLINMKYFRSAEDLTATSQ